ncbi:hypothetical protein ACFFX0_21400 [Citricoccus parietis]|uniref:Uncharacterized protein n=1 Tax=Citricoccus parietis TaxID=592307 RepID=A0ABV5G3Y4_9MICC
MLRSLRLRSTGRVGFTHWTADNYRPIVHYEIRTLFGRGQPVESPRDECGVTHKSGLSSCGDRTVSH